MMQAPATLVQARGGRRALLVVASLVLAGCAGYQPPPLAATHPAHPEAPAAREAPASQTLAYTPSDIESVRAAPPGAAVQPGEHPARQAEGRASKTAVGEGEVIAAQPNSGQIVLEHGEIKGFMDAMTMGYRIDPPSLLAKVKPGDKVRFTIDLERRAIVEIETLR
jgi:Cu/Ag efflux protein CusF